MGIRIIDRLGPCHRNRRHQQQPRHPRRCCAQASTDRVPTTSSRRRTSPSRNALVVAGDCTRCLWSITSSTIQRFPDTRSFSSHVCHSTASRTVSQGPQCLEQLQPCTVWCLLLLASTLSTSAKHRTKFGTSLTSKESTHFSLHSDCLFNVTARLNIPYTHSQFVYLAASIRNLSLSRSPVLSIISYTSS